MFGLKESLLQLIDHLSSDSNVSFAYETLRIKHTTRYLLFWSFKHQIPKDPTSHRLRFTAKTKRQQVVPIANKDNFNLQDCIKNLQLKYGDHKEASSESVLLLKHNKWSRKARRSNTPTPLPVPIEVSIEFDSKVGLIFTVEEDADWEIFLGFINHLRKEI